jgi:Bacterial PH domain
MSRLSLEPEPLASGMGVDAAAAALESVPQTAIAALDSDEIIQLSLKPSRWMIGLASWKFVAGCGLAATALALLGSNGLLAASVSAYAANAFLAAGVGRVLVAALQWASRVYVLTNRRVIRFSGVLSVEVTDCPLARITRAQLSSSLSQAVVRLGTIRFVPVDDVLPTVRWEHLSRPAATYEIVVRAIQRSRM